jgi:hypothetical protein
MSRFKGEVTVEDDRRWERLAEERAGFSKSVFHFGV